MICLNTLCLVLHQHNAGWERCFKTEGEMQTSRSSRNSSGGYRNVTDCSLVAPSRPGLKCLSLVRQAGGVNLSFNASFKQSTHWMVNILYHFWWLNSQSLSMDFSSNAVYSSSTIFSPSSPLVSCPSLAAAWQTAVVLRWTRSRPTSGVGTGSWLIKNVGSSEEF